ncbi:MAG: efflux RND transporter periplasmic adaptor subunit [Desulfovibrio sp.]|nr:MAG: efflux RND transporter periplasmic adaptor subunit [Desulfovibrio sp.]
MPNAHKKRTRRTWIIWSVFTLLAALLVLATLEAVEAQFNLRNSQTTQELDPVRVTAAWVETGPVTQWIVAEGSVRAVRKTHLLFENTGKVVFLGMDRDGLELREGSVVTGPRNGEPGQLLARLDTRDVESTIDQSQAAVEEARQQLEAARGALTRANNDLAEANSQFLRAKNLWEQGYIPEQDYEQARTNSLNAQEAVASAEADLAAQQARLESALAEAERATRGQEHTALYAPYDGVIARLNVRVGDHFDPSYVDRSSEARLSATAPVTIIDPGEMEIELLVPQYEAHMVRPDQEVLVLPGAIDWYSDSWVEDYEQPGRVYSVSPQVDRDRRASRVLVRVHQEVNQLLDGMFATCWIAVRTEQALRIPLGCLLFDDGDPYVFVAKDGAAHKREISTGISDQEYVAVLDGLESGERVVLQGRQRLMHGLPLQVLEHYATDQNHE